MIRQQRPNSLRDHNTTCKSVSSLYYVGLKRESWFQSHKQHYKFKTIKVSALTSITYWCYQLHLSFQPWAKQHQVFLQPIRNSKQSYPNQPFNNVSARFTSSNNTQLWVITTAGYITASFRKRPRPQPVRAAWHTPLTPVLSAAV